MGKRRGGSESKCACGLRGDRPGRRLRGNAASGINDGKVFDHRCSSPHGGSVTGGRPPRVPLEVDEHLDRPGKRRALACSNTIRRTGARHRHRQDADQPAFLREILATSIGISPTAPSPERSSASVANVDEVSVA